MPLKLPLFLPGKLFSFALLLLFDVLLLVPALSKSNHLGGCPLGFQEFAHANFAQVEAFFFAIIVGCFVKLKLFRLVYLSLNIFQFSLLGSLDLLDALLGVVEGRVNDSQGQVE